MPLVLLFTLCSLRGGRKDMFVLTRSLSANIPGRGVATMVASADDKVRWEPWLLRCMDMCIMYIYGIIILPCIDGTVHT